MKHILSMAMKYKNHPNKIVRMFDSLLWAMVRGYANQVEKNVKEIDLSSFKKEEQ